jgi:hypothetical protein
MMKGGHLEEKGAVPDYERVHQSSTLLLAADQLQLRARSSLNEQVK